MPPTGERNGQDHVGSNKPLTEEELRAVRKIIQADDRARWLWASARTWAMWITAVTVGIAAAKSFLADFLVGKH